MREIRGDARSIRDLLQRERYAIDYYQREFNWGQKQVSDLIEDLSEKFLEDYDDAHERSDVRGYGRYFMGSIIISQRDGKRFIVDGQQRLTTLTLLLIFLNNLQRGRDEDVQVAVEDLICSVIYGARAFNLDVPSRAPCMEACSRTSLSMPPARILRSRTSPPGSRTLTSCSPMICGTERSRSSSTG